jgi:hypothetical protein
MTLIRASIHRMKTQCGTEVEYARLMYRTKSGLLGQSLLLHRLSPEQIRLARSDFRLA